MDANKKNINQHFVIDDSTSMRPGHFSKEKDPGRMLAVAAAVEAVVPDCLEDDKDGIDICFVNNRKTEMNVTVPSEAAAFIRGVKPSGFTPLGKRILALVKNYWENFDPENHNPKNFIIIRDGEADDRNTLIEAILWCGLQALLRGADPKTVTFFFLQVGNPSALGNPETEQDRKHIATYKAAAAEAKKFLEELDDGLRDKFLDLLNKEVGKNPGLRKYIDEIKSIPDDDGLGRFDIVDKTTLQEGDADLNADGVRKAMYGARYKEMDKQEEGVHG